MHILIALATAATPIAAQATAPDYSAFVDEAAQKTGVPTIIIRAVMATESAENARAMSPKGALGLMQLMPGTWDILRRQFDLGSDPFDPHDNILAGAYYLRALYDRYGPSGFLAAYNAGPGRWESHRNTGQALPAETRAYVTTIAEKLGATILTFAPAPPQIKQPTWMESTLFLPTDTTSSTGKAAFTAGNSPFVSLPASASETPQP